MPATSRSGRLLRAPLFEAVAGFALEIDDHEVVSGHQYLTEMIVAVNAYFLPLAVLRCGCFEPGEEPILLCQYRVRLVAIGRPESARGWISAAPAHRAPRRARAADRPRNRRASAAPERSRHCRWGRPVRRAVRRCAAPSVRITMRNASWALTGTASVAGAVRCSSRWRRRYSRA